MNPTIGSLEFALGLLPFLPLLAAAFACLGTDAEATAGAMPAVGWTTTIGPVHALLAASVLIIILKVARGAHRRRR